MFKKEKFTDYEDFLKRFKLDIPENFNFAFDVIDKNAQSNPDDLAMIHIDDAGQREDYNLKFFSEESSKLA
ncbi:MAG: acyl-CoA synthetase, partial [Desulfonatronovibrio sp.]